MSEIRPQATPAVSVRDRMTRIARTLLVTRQYHSPSMAMLGLIDALADDGWPKPRTVNSATELDALPHESVIRDSLGDVYEKWSPLDVSMTEWMTPGTSWTPAPTLPATVLFTPGDAG